MKRDENGERLTDEQRAERQREIVGQYLTIAVVANVRLSAVLKVVAGLRPSELIGVIKVGLDGMVYTAVEQRFGFPYQEIEDRDMRRVVWAALETQDDEDWLRVIILDQPHKFVANIRVAYAPAPPSESIS